MKQDEKLKEIVAYIEPYQDWIEVEAIFDRLDAEFDFADRWIVFASGIGWRNLEGHKTFEAGNAQDFIVKSFGFDCDFSVKLYKVPQGFEATYYHHDSPTGESREMIRAKDYVFERVTKDFTIQELQRFLTNYAEVLEEKAEWLLDYLPEKKERRKLAKQDFAELVWQFCEEDYDTGREFGDLDQLVAIIDNYANGDYN